MDNLIGDRIKKALTESGKDVPGLAKYMDTTVQTVYRWMRGEVEPSVSNIRRIGAFTGHPAEYFVASPGTLYRYKSTEGPRPAPATTLVIYRGGQEQMRIKLDEDTRLEMILEKDEQAAG